MKLEQEQQLQQEFILKLEQRAAATAGTLDEAGAESSSDGRNFL